MNVSVCVCFCTDRYMVGLLECVYFVCTTLTVPMYAAQPVA